MRRKIKGRERFLQQRRMACGTAKAKRTVPIGGDFIPILLKLYHGANVHGCLQEPIAVPGGFFAEQRVFEAMTDDEKHMSGGGMEAEFRRQMRSGQMNRFVGTLPHYAVHQELPDRFVKLLRQIDRPRDHTASHAGGARNRQN